MKIIYTLVLLICLIGCSKEQKQQQQENLVVQAMVNGQWKVTSFNKGGTDVTSDFSVYKFQFKSDLTVDAINNGAVEKTGAWNADANAQTITSNFSNAVNPLVLLNGTWTITNTTWTSVQANQTVNGELRTLRLDKL
jgi:hypothetical protein